jgi:uncharacterized membrane protein
MGYEPQLDQNLETDLLTSRGKGAKLPKRFLPLDLLRGLIIVLMALDHANYFIAQQHSSGEYWGGAIPVFPSTQAFLTRLVTHYCAPGFFFLMGVGMILFADSRRRSGWSERKITQHFVMRGLLLILMQLTLINFFWRLGPFRFPPLYIGVLIALGGGMILSSFLVRLKPPLLLFFALIFFIGTEFLHPDPSLWNLLETDPFNLILLRSGGTENFWSNYPILPWMELILFGMAFGHWFRMDQAVTYRRAALVGLTFLVAFFALRTLNGFGNIRPRPGDTWMDFLNLVKYPPSMTFTLFTMGGNLLILWILSRLPQQILSGLKPLAVFGQEPFFFYILHIPVYAGLGYWLTPNGASLGVMYLLWGFGLICFYALTRRYAVFKQQQPQESLWRFL